MHAPPGILCQGQSAWGRASRGLDEGCQLRQVNCLVEEPEDLVSSHLRHRELRSPMRPALDLLWSVGNLHGCQAEHQEEYHQVRR
jgi:hypothetical protein